MAIVAGIDEAGYGPLLGPLVVSGAVFQVPDELAEASLWRTLKASIKRGTSARDRRLPVMDSKKLYSPALGLKMLERTALVKLRMTGCEAATFRDLLRALAPHAVDGLSAHPWYAQFDSPLPAACGERDVATRANAVRRDMKARGVRLLGVFCEPLLEGEFNRLVAATNNKAVVSLGLVWRIVQRILLLAGQESAHIHIDRQGGREYYGPHIMTCFDRYQLRILEESDLRSSYELTNGAARHTVDFTVGGEDRHLPIALASIYSKYVRELFMSAFNGWWTKRIDGLKPTAGYHGDGQRFIRDITPTALRLGIDRASLVRCR